VSPPPGGRAGATRPPAGDERVDAVFAALADSTRRTVLRTVVTDGPITATVIADDLPVSRQAIAKHLQVLQGAGLVRAERAGRESRYEATTAALRSAVDWIEATDAAWSRRLGDLGREVARRRSSS
jgi:DNA-binding transcriptional ArsR family regulator